MQEKGKIIQTAHVCQSLWASFLSFLPSACAWTAVTTGFQHTVQAPGCCCCSRCTLNRCSRGLLQHWAPQGRWIQRTFRSPGGSTSASVRCKISVSRCCCFLFSARGQIKADQRAELHASWQPGVVGGWWVGSQWHSSLVRRREFQTLAGISFLLSRDSAEIRFPFKMYLHVR